ncbi:Mss4-like protein [Irpex rosettiformis]|uniref:Mss4-like protein n=1 Tax=Irpex rosettiformis TaxID=378272 RepID=A0ACB8UFQ7_9APHY|nr:Mss4-like protein [Irpex rosettiformis]
MSSDKDQDQSTITVIKGRHVASCLCGQIAYEIQITFTKGEDLQKLYADGNTTSGGIITRSFCPNCGSHLSAVGSLPDGKVIFVVPAGIVDEDISGSWKPQTELFCKSRPKWLPNTGFEQHETSF